MDPRGVPALTVVGVAAALVLSACTATSDASPTRSAEADSAVPTTAAAPAPAVTATPAEAPLTAGQARVLLPLEYFDDGALAAFGAQESSTSPFDLTTVGLAVSDAHLNQSAEPAACGIVDGVWYGSAVDRDVTDSLLGVGIVATDAPSDTPAIEQVRVFPTEAAAADHFSELSGALGSCTTYVITDSQAGTSPTSTDDVVAGADTLGYVRRSDGDIANGVEPWAMTVRVRLVQNALVTVVGSDAALVEGLDHFVAQRAGEQFPG